MTEGSANIPMPQDEQARRDALHALDVLDTPAEVEFDALAKVAALICGTPIALISLIDTDRQWFKANIGLEGVRETHRNAAFCAHAIMKDEVMEVSDARRDGRFSSNPLVTSKAAIRFYAGAPLRLNNGSRIGTLCVLDREPKKLDARQREALQHLSIVVVEALKRRRATLARLASDSATDSAESIAQEGTWEWNVLDGQLIVNNAWATTLGCEPLKKGSIDIEFWLNCLVATDRTRFKDMLQRLASGTVEKIEGEFGLANPRAGHVRIQAHVHLWTADDRPEWIFGTQIDLSAGKVRDNSIQPSASIAETTQSSNPVDAWHFDIATKTMKWGSQVCLLCGVSSGYQPEFPEFLRFYPDDARLQLERAFNRAVGLGEPFDLTLAFFRPNGDTTTVRVTGVPEFNDGATPIRLTGSLVDVGQ